MTYQIQIDDNVPLPSRRSHPLGLIDVGQSYFVPGLAVTAATGNFGYHRPKKFTARTVTENGVKGVRVWRVE